MKKNAISLIEIIISTAILGVILTMISSIITKKANISADISHGTFICYKDSQGKLNQKVNLTDGTIQERNDIEQCRFSFPRGVEKYTVHIIGAGGGGGKISSKENEYYEITSNQSSQIRLLSNDKTMGCIEGDKEYSPCEKSSSLGLQTYPFNTEKCSEQYNCSKSIIHFSFPNNDNIGKIFTKDALQKVALENRPMYVKSGKNSSDSKELICAFRKTMIFDKEFNYFNGYDETNCNQLSRQPVITAGPGIFKFGNDSVRANSMGFSDETPVENMCKSVSYTPACIKEGNIDSVVKINSIALNEIDNLEFGLVSPKARFSSGGKAGEVKKLSNVNELAGETLIIEKENIGTGGAAGEAGGNTIFKIPNKKSTAFGGQAGSSSESMLSTSLEDVSKITLSDLILKNGIYTLAESRYINNYTIQDDNKNGQLSSYVEDNSLAGVVNSDIFVGKGAFCDEQTGTCSSSVSPNNESYGSGGGGGSSLVKYDKISKIKYSRPNFAKDVIELTLEANHTPKVEIYNGSNGMGGAIVIEW